ncbi:UNVERIFIED_CONTAM: hypothetical protein PYX00_010967 [Menopon gallinae]|uniref:60S ribosomal protein L18a n=1 Tax=Menopon gallinae TaxID=328185 RepID=A0AAW2H6L3_9NEOP
MWRCGGIKEYRIYGSKIPTEQEVEPQIFFHDVFAKNEIVARSRFNNLMKTRYKIKPGKLVVLKIEELLEDIKDMKIKNYGIQLVYRSKKGIHNMYKEFRSISRCKAVEMLFNDMAGRHKAKRDDIKIVSVKELATEELRRDKVIQFTKENVMYPIFKKKLNSKPCI